MGGDSTVNEGAATTASIGAGRMVFTTTIPCDKYSDGHVPHASAYCAATSSGTLLALDMDEWRWMDFGPTLELLVVAS